MYFNIFDRTSDYFLKCLLQSFFHSFAADILKMIFHLVCLYIIFKSFGKKVC